VEHYRAENVIQLFFQKSIIQIENFLNWILQKLPQPFSSDFFNLQNQKMEQHIYKNVNNCLNTNINSYLEISDGQSSDLCLNVVYFFNTNVN